MRDLPQRRSLELVCLVLTLVVFAIDVRTPLGFTVWIFYLVPLALALFTWRPSLPFVLAALATIFVVIDLFVSPAGTSRRISEINRTGGTFVFWVTAFVGHGHIRGKIQLFYQDWIQTRQTQLNVQLRGDLVTDDVIERAVQFLALQLDAPVAAGWLIAPTVRRVATFGLDGGGEPPGPGLIVQAAKDGQLRAVSNLPATYLAARSGLGEAQPLELVLVPAHVEGKTHGVIELGRFRALHASERELLERVSEAIAVAIRSAEYRSRLRDLLEETQRQSEELQAQQEELRVSNEELEAQTQSLRAAQALQERAQVELEETNASLEEQATLMQRQRDELRRAQGELVGQADALARASQYKSEFLANMSHELRTPLNSALILSKLLANNPQGNLTDEQVKFAEAIYGAGNDLLGLINDILDLSKIEAGRMDLVVGVVPLARLKTALLRTFEPVARGKGLGLTIEISSDAPPSIDTDEARLLQVLRNLISNALKFTEVGQVTVRVRPHDGGLAFEVRDTGIGIGEDQQEVIFEAFRQADGTTSRRFGGTGLGLSISRELARLLGGEIAVTSAPGQGSTFTITVPLAIQGAAHPSAAPVAVVAPTPSKPIAPPAPAPPPITADDRDHLDKAARLLLVIEDDPKFAGILVELAHELDFQVLVAGTADEGVRLATLHRPSGILLDVRLPDHSGLSVLERLKRRASTRHIPVHLLSVEDFAQRALEMGAVGYLLKPARREELVEAVRKVEAQLSPRVRRLLIAEDDPLHRASLRQLLGGEQIEIVDVPTVRESLEALRAHSFDCVVVDLTLADGTGFDLLEQMAADESVSFPPVIIHTGRQLTAAEEQRLRRFSASIVIKGARSPERLLDEVTLFLHQVESDLPVERQRQLEAVRDREAVFEGKKVLVVEDDVRNVFALTSTLEPKGATTVIARNGREALEQLEHEPAIDLVLMDVMMPEMDGIECTKAIRARREWAKLPIIALTAKTMKDDREKCLDAGASDYLAKPIDVEMLLSLCRVWMPR